MKKIQTRKVQQNWKFRFYDFLSEWYSEHSKKIQHYIDLKANQHWVEDWDTFLPEAPTSKPKYTVGFFASMDQKIHHN